MYAVNIKSRLRHLLGDLLIKQPVNSHKDRLINKQAIKHSLQKEVGVRTDSPGGFIRILAKDDKNASEIIRALDPHKHELGIKHIQAFEKPIDYLIRHPGAPLYTRSVLVQQEPGPLFNSATSQLMSDHLNSIKQDIKEDELPKQRVVIDFSSPNIAKPIHYGHLKSTILGNSLAKFLSFVGHDVTKLNYIGDWGTQYGLLSLGLDRFSDELGTLEDKTSKCDKLKHLVEIYVKANDLGNSDKEFYNKAKERTCHMSSTDVNNEHRDRWQNIRDLSIDELKSSYDTLGIKFDIFEFESEYANDSVKMIKELLESGKASDWLSQLDDGPVVAKLEHNFRPFEVPLLKADGTSLYLSRDLLAALRRKQTFNYDKMLYVVGQDQSKHFQNLRLLVSKMHKSISTSSIDRSSYEETAHVMPRQLIPVYMGKVVGMSTRRGEYMLLSDVIEETRQNYAKSTNQTVTSKHSSCGDSLGFISHQLALSALFVYDMRNLRNTSYRFDWPGVVTPHARCGINLQTAHARLASLIERALSESSPSSKALAELTVSDFESADSLVTKLSLVATPNIEPLWCVEAMDLLSQLSELDTALQHSLWSLDPSYLVNYSLTLARVVNRARLSDRLRVSDEREPAKLVAKLLLFGSARLQLALCIQLLGLRPLNKV